MKQRRVLSNGRSSSQLMPKAKKVLSPPKGEPWSWHAREMLKSPAWRALGINARRFLDFLETDHMSHAGLENGNLMATYDQLRDHGIFRSEISGAIEQAIALGFVKRTSPRVMRVPMTYRLTYFGTIEDGIGVPPSNDWKRHDPQSAKAAKIRTRGNNSAGTETRTRLPLKVEPETPNSAKPNSQIA